MTNIIILGDSESGKSSLVHRFCFPTDIPHVSRTVAIDCTSRILKFDQKVFKIRFWDIAGGPQWMSLYATYIKNAHVAIVVYDVTSKQSFVNISKWINMVRNIHGFKFPIIIIANKIDKEKERITQSCNMKNYDCFNDIFFVETSALYGTNCRNALKIILSQSKEVVTTTVEKPWYHNLFGL